jgi:peptidoglycan/LPS O-acetylase OafA/YrhL
MNGRIFELDLLRGIAILLVMGVHVPAYPIWSTSGWIGVDLFFVLSGFLISNLLFSEYRATGNIRLGRFFVRRALKLYPSFYLMLACTLAYCLVRHVPFSGSQVAGEALMTQNYIGSLWGHTWSLAVEEHFYLCLPLALAAMLAVRKFDLIARGGVLLNAHWYRHTFAAVPYLFAIVAALCLGFRFAAFVALPVYDHRVAYELSHLRIDSLFAGVLLGYLHNFRPDILRKAMSQPYRYPLSIVSVACLAPAIFLEQGNPIVYTIGFSLLYIGFGIVLLLALYPEKVPPCGRPLTVPSFRLAAIVAELGTYSYTVYLWHVPMAMVFGAIAGRFPALNPLILHALYFGTSIAIGVLAAQLIERPILRMRDRIFGAPRAFQGRKAVLAA